MCHWHSDVSGRMAVDCCWLKPQVRRQLGTSEEWGAGRRGGWGWAEGGIECWLKHRGECCAGVYNNSLRDCLESGVGQLWECRLFFLSVCVRACVRAFVRACARACVCACVPVCVRVLGFLMWAKLCIKASRFILREGGVEWGRSGFLSVTNN